MIVQLDGKRENWKKKFKTEEVSVRALGPQRLRKLTQ